MSDGIRKEVAKPPEARTPRKRSDAFKDAAHETPQRGSYARKRQVAIHERTIRFPRNVSQAIDAVCDRYYPLPPSRYVARAVLEMLLKFDPDIGEQFGCVDKHRGTIWDEMNGHSNVAPYDPHREATARAGASVRTKAEDDMAALAALVMPPSVPPAPTRAERVIEIAHDAPIPAEDL